MNNTAQNETAQNAPENGQRQTSDIVVLTPGASGAEIAAATAVLQDALKELADEAAEPTPGRSPWLGSSRKLREPIGPGHPGWHSFNG